VKYEEIKKILKSQKNEKNIAGMGRFGIRGNNLLGISIPFLRKLASQINKDYRGKDKERHELALKLWDSDIHEARHLAGMIDVSELVTKSQMDKWASEFDSWDICDGVCMNIWYKVPYSYDKAIEWTSKKEEYYKRAGFVLMTVLSWKNKEITKEKVRKFYPYLIKHSTDERNFVKKAINWAIRQIGKSRLGLKDEMIALSEEILKTYPESKSARWIANGAIRELLQH
jgi:3-methyladenine DNA glycosylase AlkD